MPLKVLVAGAGIGGLTAALGLRRQGHDVEVFEQSRLLKEYGAAISVPSNANAILRRLGVNLEHYGAVPFDGLQLFWGDEQLAVIDKTEEHKDWPYPYLFVLRADLHRAIKDAALSMNSEGKPVTLHTASKIHSVDAQSATITLEDGSVHTGDIVVGADGVHSKARKAIEADKEFEPFDHDKSAFRMLIPTEHIAADPVTAPYLERQNYFTFWQRENLVVIMYPGAGGKMMNCVAMQPSELTAADSSAGWHQAVDKDHMLDLYKDFGVGVRALLSKAEPDRLGLWQLLDMKSMPTYAQDRVALIGDAAHPFLPFMGQGGAMAIEDGGALAALLPADTEPSAVADRLLKYDGLRHDRTTLVQNKTRVQGASFRTKGDMEKMMKNFTAFGRENHLYDAWDEAQKSLVAATA